MNNTIVGWLLIFILLVCLNENEATDYEKQLYKLLYGDWSNHNFPQGFCYLWK